MREPTSQPGARLAFVDNLRILLISLVVLLHLSITYGAPGDWYYHEVQPGELPIAAFALLALFVSCNQAFFMGLFFFVSAVFTPASCDRKGPGRYLADRLARLGIPLVVYVLVIDPLIHYLLATSLRGFEGGLLEYLGLQLERFRGFGFGPLWFVEALLIFNLVYLLVRWARPPSKRAPDVQPRAPSNQALLLFGLGLGLVSFSVRIWLPIGWTLAPLSLQLPFFPQYIALFAAGLAAGRRGWLTAIPDAAGRLWGWAAAGLILLWIGVFSAGGALDGDVGPFMGGGTWQSLAYALWEQLFCVAISVRLLTWFRRRFDRQGPLARGLSTSAYGVFVIHSPVLVAAALALRGVELHPLVKLGLLAPAVLALCFGLAWLLKRLPGVRRVL